MRSVLTSDSFYRFASSCFFIFTFTSIALHCYCAVKTSVSIPVRFISIVVTLLVVHLLFSALVGLRVRAFFGCILRQISEGLFLSMTDGQESGKKFTTYNKSASNHGVRSDHYIGSAFSMLYDRIERPIAIATDSACLILSENNQFIVYTHNIDLSLISFLPHQILLNLHIY